MTSEERDRAALIRAATESWGEEVATTLSEQLPPPGDRPATKRDIDGVLAAFDAMDERHESRLDGSHPGSTAWSPGSTAWSG